VTKQSLKRLSTQR